MSFSSHPAKAAFQLVVVGSLLLYGAFSHADGAPDTQARQRAYEEQRQRCLSGQTGQQQASCLQEAGAVRQQGLAAQSTLPAAQLEENSLQRCDALADGERQSCIARMQGNGHVDGSVAGGGILRELREPAQ